MLDLIPNQYQFIAKTAIVGLIFIFGMFGGYKLASSYYTPQIEGLEIKVQAFEDAYNSLAISVVSQNTAIDDLKNKSEVKSKSVKQQQEKVKIEADKLYKESDTLANLKINSTDKCKAALELIDTEIAKEFQ